MASQCAIVARRLSGSRLERAGHFHHDPPVTDLITCLAIFFRLVLRPEPSHFLYLMCRNSGRSINAKYRVNRRCTQVFLYVRNLSIADSDDLTTCVVIGGAIHGFCGSGYLSDHEVTFCGQALYLWIYSCFKLNE
jgi:hypothetical protein